MGMSKNLTLFACKLENSNGVAVHVDPVTDIAYVTEGSVEINQLTDKLDILSGSFTTEKAAMGNVNANIKAKVPIFSNSATEEPDIGKFFECFSFNKTSQVVGETTKHIYERGVITTSKSMSVIDVALNSSGNNAIIKSAHGVMYQSMKFTLESGKIAVAEFNGLGLVGGVNNELTEIDAETIQNITKPNKLIRQAYTVNSCNCIFGDTGYELVNFTVDLTNKIQQIPKMTGCGFGPADLCSEESKFTCSTLLDTSMNPLPYTKMKKCDTLNVTIEFGQIQNRRIRIEFQGQITGVKDNQQGDLLGSEISGDIIDNKIKITFNTDAIV